MKKILLGISLMASLSVLADSGVKDFFQQDVDFFHEVLTNAKVKTHLVERIEGCTASDPIPP